MAVVKITGAEGQVQQEFLLLMIYKCITGIFSFFANIDPS